MSLLSTNQLSEGIWKLSQGGSIKAYAWCTNGGSNELFVALDNTLPFSSQLTADPMTGPSLPDNEADFVKWACNQLGGNSLTTSAWRATMTGALSVDCSTGAVSS